MVATGFRFQVSGFNKTRQLSIQLSELAGTSIYWSLFPDLWSLSFLPAWLHDAGDLSLERQRPEAQAAYAKLAQKASRPSAELAPVVLAAAELRLPRVFHSLCSSCHNPLQLQLL